MMKFEFIKKSLRTIRFQEVRDFISENAVTISLIIIFIILIYVTFSRRAN